MNPEVLRPHAEQLYADELSSLAALDTHPRPPGWKLSPRAVRRYLLGGEVGSVAIRPKYIGRKELVEIAIATLLTERALLLFGVPGTAKSWLSEHLAAAISGDSTVLIQGTAGTDEAALRYSWNYAKLLADGPSADALVDSPLLAGMRAGKIVRVEELTRIPGEVQDTLISVLSEKTLPIPELQSEVQAVPGFNLIATANDRDRGVHELSSALMRRFNTVVLPLPVSLEEEVRIVEQRVAELGEALPLPAQLPAAREVRRVVRMFRELRAGQSDDGPRRLQRPSGTLSTAEAIAVLHGGLAQAACFGDGVLRAADVASGLTGTVIKDPGGDRVAWLDYLDAVVKRRDGWQDLYRACLEVLEGPQSRGKR